MHFDNLIEIMAENKLDEIDFTNLNYDQLAMMNSDLDQIIADFSVEDQPDNKERAKQARYQIIQRLKIYDIYLSQATKNIDWNNQEFDRFVAELEKLRKKISKQLAEKEDS